jgi:hypothetical protein
LNWHNQSQKKMLPNRAHIYSNITYSWLSHTAAPQPLFRVNALVPTNSLTKQFQHKRQSHTDTSSEQTTQGTAAASMTGGLLTTTETEDQVEGRLLLDIVVGKGAAILQLLARKDQTLLVWGDALLVLDLGLHIVDGVGTLNLQSDGLASQCLDEDLHPTPQAEHQVESALLLNVVISKGAAILKLLASKDEPLLVWRDALLVLDLGLDIVNGVRRLNLNGDSLAS